MSVSAPAPTRPDNPVDTPKRPRKRRQLTPWALLSPAGIVVLVITIVPIALLIYYSFTDYDQRSLFTGEWSVVGLDQYKDIFTSGDFWHSVLRTVWFTAALVIGTILIGAGVAQLMTRITSWLRYVVTIILVLAWGVPNVASSVVWNFLFEPGYGIINWILTQLHIFGDMTSTDWGNSTPLAFTSIWLLIVWQAVPFVALTLYAALLQVPAGPVEAARIDGAGEWRIWWNVKLPYLRPTLLLIIILSIIWDANVFNQIWLVSEGGPGDSTSTLGVYTFKKAFVGFDVGTGAAISVVTTILLVLVTSVYIRNLLRAGEDL